MMDGGRTSGPCPATTGHQHIFNTFKYFCLSSKVQWCINYLLWTYFNIFNSSYYSGHILRFIPIKMSGELRCLARGDAVTSWLVELDKIFITITIWAGLGWAGVGWVMVWQSGRQRWAQIRTRIRTESSHQSLIFTQGICYSDIQHRILSRFNITFVAHINANKSIILPCNLPLMNLLSAPLKSAVCKKFNWLGKCFVAWL